MGNMNQTSSTQVFTAMYPYELARAAGVSRRTMIKWIQAHREELVKLGFTHGTRLLPPSAVKFISEFYCIDLSNTQS